MLSTTGLQIMFKFEVWEVIRCSYLRADRVYEGCTPVIDWEYIVELPDPMNGDIHYVDLVETELVLPREPVCELEKAADGEVKCKACGV